MKLDRMEWVYRQTDSRLAVHEWVAYSRAWGTDMIRFRWSGGSASLSGPAALSFSTDNGDTWREGPDWPAREPAPEGAGFSLWTYPVTVGDYLLMVGASGIIGNSSSGLPQAPCCRISDDGGHTWTVDEPIIQTGPGLNAAQPFPGVSVDTLAVVPTGTPLILKDGRVLVPCHRTLAGDGSGCFCPPGSSLYTAACVLEGRWLPNGHLSWRLMEPVRIKPEQSLKGACEPALAEMPDGRLLMVMSAGGGSRDPQACYKWFSVSSDCGRMWSRPWPWTFSDGTAFFSPGSPSRLFRHSSGDWYWLGVITPEPGENARYPLVIGRVDPVSLRLDMETLSVIDTRREDDGEGLDLSGFSLFEDRRTGDLVLRLTRLDRDDKLASVKGSVIACIFDL